jgi:hypothetical protein
LIQDGGHIDSNILHTYGFYDVYKNDVNKIEEDFSNLQSEFYKANASEKLSDQDDWLICYCPKTAEFKREYGGFENYYLKLKKKEKEDKAEEAKKEGIENKKNAMVNHNYWFARPISITLFFIAALAFFNIDSIKDLVNFGKTNAKEGQESHADSAQKAKLKYKEVKSLQHQEERKDTDVLKTDS